MPEARLGQMHQELCLMKQLFAVKYPTQRRRWTPEQGRRLGLALGIMTQAGTIATPATVRRGRLSLGRREEKIRKRGASVIPKTATLRILVVLPVPAAPLVLFQTIHRILWIQIVTTVPSPTTASARLGLLPLTSEP